MAISKPSEVIQNFAQDIVDTVREPLIILDASLCVHSANSAFYHAFKVLPEDTENRLIYELGNGQWDIPALRLLLEDIVPMSSVFNDFELEHHFPTIGRKVMLLNARKLRPGDHTEYLVLAIEDITERRRAERLLAEVDAYAQNIVDTVREPLLLLDAGLHVHSANRAFYQTFAVSQEETEGSSIYNLGNGQWDIPALRTLLEDILAKNSVFNDFELEHDFPSIGRRTMLVNARELRSANDAQLLLVALEDVTEKRRVHDIEVRFTQELQKSYERLQALEKLRDDLTNMIVHDLRTPLTSVIAGMKMLISMGDLNPEQSEMAEIASLGGETLLEMINDMLDVDKMESGSMQLEHDRIDVYRLADAAIHQIRFLAESESVKIDLVIPPDLPPLVGDEIKLRRVLVNLLGNAIKFTPSGGNVTVEAQRKSGSDSLTFFIRDDGEGIPSEHFGRIFEKFAQVESRKSGRTMSTGLGLTFCKLAVEAHGGEIGVESTVGKGSVFWFSLPVDQIR